MENRKELSAVQKYLISAIEKMTEQQREFALLYMEIHTGIGEEETNEFSGIPVCDNRE